MKRMFWMGVGMVAGAGGTIWAERKVKERINALSPENVAVAAGSRAVAAGRSVLDAVSEGRGAMREREDELRAAKGWATPSRTSSATRPGAAGAHHRPRATRHR